MFRNHDDRIRVVAGGTDLIPSMRQKLFEPEYVLDLRSDHASCGGFDHSPTVASRLAR